MAVKDFMTKRVVYVSPETTVAAAADIMRDKGLRRLPVIEHDKLVGLITEGTMEEASPSKATSLSNSIALISTHSATCAIPALPGAQYILSTLSDWLIFQHIACSRPPLPTTNTFIISALSYIIC